MKRAPVPFTSEEGWAFEELLQSSIAAQPGASFEERLAALAKLPGWEWVNEPLPLTPHARNLCGQYRRNRDEVEGRARAKLVRPLRKKLGLIQAEAAERMGLARTSVVAIEKGTRGVSLDEFERLAAQEGKLS